MSNLQIVGLEMPSTVDPMETDTDRRAGQVEDIDIDLDLTGGQQQDGEDEYMSEDVAAFNEQAPGAIQAGEDYNDDEMADDGDMREAAVEAASVQEEDLQDEDLQDAEEIITAQADEDDEIIDVVDDEPMPISQNAAAPQYQKPTASGDPNDQNQNQENQPSQPGLRRDMDHVQYQNSFNHDDGNSQSRGRTQLSNAQEEPQVINEDAPSESQKTNTQDLGAESSLDLYPDAQQLRGTPEPVASGMATQALSQNVNHTSNDYGKIDDQRLEESDYHARALGDPEFNDEHLEHDVPPPSPDAYAPNQKELTDQYEYLSKSTTYTHPVVVIYQGAEISLFRPVDGDQDFLLEDEHLTGDSITNLLAACRPVLGEDVHEHELVISVGDLDLEISEFAKDASNTTISQLIDIYLQLQHNDGVQTLQDLHLKLFTKPSFSHRLDFLRNAMEEGKGLSQVKPTNDDQEKEEVHTLPDQAGKYEDTNVHDQVFVPTEYESHKQEREDNKTTMHETGPVNVPGAPILEEESALQSGTLNDDVQTLPELSTGAVKAERKLDEAYNHRTDERSGEQTNLVDNENTADPYLGNDRPLQEEREPALPDDEESIIDYEDEGAVGPKSSSGSSTLHGDVDPMTDQTLTVSDQPGALKEEVFPKTETGSHTSEESSNDLVSYNLHASNEGDEVLDEKDVREEENKSQKVEEHENVETEVMQSKTIQQANGYDLEAEVDQSADVVGKAGDEDRDHDDILNVNQFEDTYTEYQDADYQTEEDQHLDYQSGQIQPAIFYANDGGEHIEDFADLDYYPTYHEIGLHKDLQEGNSSVEEVFEDDDDLEAFTGNKTMAIVDEDQMYQNEVATDAEGHPSTHATAQADENDEITYQDEERETKPSIVEQDELPNPGSLKRSRSHPDADNTTAEDLQDAKRVRST